MSITAIVTTAGLSELTNAVKSGLTINLTEIAVGDGTWATPADTTATTLQNEVLRFAIDQWQQVGTDSIKLASSVRSDSEFTIREAAVFTATGTLFAVWQRNDPPLLFKSAEVSNLLVSSTFSVTGLPAKNITIVDSGSELNLILDMALLEINTNQMQQQADIFNLSRRLNLAGL
ncbi:MAG: phage tail protein [Cyanobacteria bacterium SBLK]|nr:phage tail protein [Cyanobacteria bacterium SBLK]